MNKKQELEYIAKYNIKNGTHFYNLEQIVNHASQNSKPEKQSALQRIGSALTQSEGRSATEKAILDGSAEATSKKLQEIGIDKESANQAVINPAYNTDKTTAALNTTLLTLLPDISAGIPGIIRLGTGMVGGYLGNRGGKYLDDKFGTSFLQGIGSFAGGLTGYSFGNKTIPDIINSAIIRKNLKTGKLEFVGPKNYIGYHQSNTYFETPQFPLNNRWDVINHNADPNGFFLTLNSPATSGFLAKRPYILKFNVNSNKGLVQHGEIKGFSGSKNNIRNKIVKYARKNGADVVHFDGIKDNTLPNQQILFATDKSGIKSLNNRENLPAIVNQDVTLSSNTINPRYLNGNDLNAENIVEDYLSGRKSAIDFLGSEIKQVADKRNLELAKRIGYDKFDPNLTGNIRASVPMKKGINQNAIWLGDTNDGFYFTTKPIEDNAKAEIILRQNPSNDQLIITPFTNIDRTTFHEFLHRGNYGASQNKSSSNDPWNIIRNFQTDNFYNWKTKHLLKNEIPTDDYLFKSGESATNFLETGIKEMGLSFGQPYPGKRDALNFYKKFLAGNSPKTFVLEKSKWETKPKRIWDALTGKYYTLPLIGAIGTREGLKND